MKWCVLTTHFCNIHLFIIHPLCALALTVCNQSLYIFFGDIHTQIDKRRAVSGAVAIKPKKKRIYKMKERERNDQHAMATTTTTMGTCEYARGLNFYCHTHSKYHIRVRLFAGVCVWVCFILFSYEWTILVTIQIASNNLNAFNQKPFIINFQISNMWSYHAVILFAFRDVPIR